MPGKDSPVLKAKNVHKWYGKVHALQGMDFEIYPGEVVGLVGDNGAGKSTFAKIIAGVLKKDKGEIYWEGEETEITSIQKARELGIETVYQEQALVDQLSVAKNIYLGREETGFGPLNIVDEDKMLEECREAMENLGLQVPAEQEVRFCSGGERQGVAVARAIKFRAKLVILDEPTRALSPKGVKRVLEFIEEMKEENIAVIHISHTFSHIYPTADRFVIMSRGEIIAEKDKEETSPDELTDIIIQEKRDVSDKTGVTA